MSGVIDVVSRPVGESDIAFGANSFVYVDINGVARRVNQVNAGSVPWLGFPTQTVEQLVDGSKALPVGASNLAVLNTSVFNGPVYCSGVTSGLVKNFASGLLLFGQALAVGDMPTGIPASNIAAGIVNDTEFGYIDGLTSTAQVQIDGLASDIAGMAGLARFQPTQRPRIVFSSVTTVNVLANATTPAWVIMNGFPDILNPGLYVSNGATDSAYYSVTGTTGFVITANTWGAEQASQWYALFAVSSGASYIIKGMPFLRMKSHASQVISTGTLVTPANARDYTFTANEFVNGKVYILSGTNAGEVRTITSNGTSGGASTVTYSGTNLAGLAQGDWLIVLPPTINFRWIGDIYNSAGGNIVNFRMLGNTVQWLENVTAWGVTIGPVVSESVPMCSPLATEVTLVGGTSLDLVGHPSISGLGSPQFNAWYNPPSHYTGHTPTEFCKIYLNITDVVYSSAWYYPVGI